MPSYCCRLAVRLNAFNVYRPEADEMEEELGLVTAEGNTASLSVAILFAYQSHPRHLASCV
jgi:hypothetical protein